MKTLLFASLCLAGAAYAAPALAQQYLECSSDSGRVQRCPADTSGGVTLSSQYSRAGCYQNDTWGYDRNGVWVSNGCRAQFRIGEQYRSRSSSGGSAAAIAAIALIGAAVIASQKDKHGGNDYNDNNWNNQSNQGYDREYDRGCNDARRGRRWADNESVGWRNGFRDCD